ncbi:MAG: type II toxin-antitoxin system VapC family toxin [Crenarchaeota archaeon]|nr:type II toxin-antitoxin system VapC family toxin [Thermoproteota archaeon]
MEKYVLDTGVIVEYIVEKSPRRAKVVNLFNAAARGEVQLFVTPITLSEVIYVASRLYQVAGIEDPNREALNFVTWVTGRVTLVELDERIAVRAGELKKTLRIALPDCYVIASAEVLGAMPLFRAVEREMESVLNVLKRLSVVFLDELNI